VERLYNDTIILKIAKETLKPVWRLVFGVWRSLGLTRFQFLETLLHSGSI